MTDPAPGARRRLAQVLAPFSFRNREGARKIYTEGNHMNIVMSSAERTAFESYLRPCARYVEFGCGGSTVLSAKHVKDFVVSVDSSQDWLDKVRVAFEAESPSAKLHLELANIGPTAAWGHPDGVEHQAKWHLYHSRIWRNDLAKQGDFYLVDGRFRVACFIQTLLNGNPDALIGFHDFEVRPEYHIARSIAVEVARVENFSVFRPEKGQAKGKLRALLRDYAEVPI
jgi:hypothetical protein